MFDIDSSDRLILSTLQADARVSLDNLAHLTDLSPATVQRRLRRLRESGLIHREVAILDADALGWGMTFLVLVEMERERLDVLDSFKRRMRAEQQVQQCYYITGDADFALICLARDMKDFDQLTQRLFFDDSNIRRFRTNVVMDRTKVSLDVGTQEEE